LCIAVMLRKRHPSGEIESHAAFAQRKFCSNRCHAIYRGRKQVSLRKQMQMEYVAA
jgi:hypothetical protein